jgi:hypothetical protein
MSSFLRQLAGGDHRSIGKANQVAAKVLAEPGRLAEIMSGMRHEDALVRMRCADVAEKVSAVHPEWLAPHKAMILDLAAEAIKQELRWHLAQILPRLDLVGQERQRSVAVMFAYLADPSRIVQVCAMPTLARFAVNDATLRRELAPLLHVREQNGSTAVRARARKLIRWLRNYEREHGDQQSASVAAAAPSIGKAAGQDGADIGALISQQTFIISTGSKMGAD